MKTIERTNAPAVQDHSRGSGRTQTPGQSCTGAPVVRAVNEISGLRMSGVESVRVQPLRLRYTHPFFPFLLIPWAHTDVKNTK